MKSTKLVFSAAVLAFAATLTGCGIGGALSGTAAAAQVIEDDSEAKLGISVNSVSCEEAGEDADFDFTCEGDSDLGKIRFQVVKNGNVVTYTPVNIFTTAEASAMEADVISNLQVSELDCGDEPPYYLPLDTMSLVCTGTSADGAATEITVTVDEATLQYTYQITGTA